MDDLIRQLPYWRMDVLFIMVEYTLNLHEDHGVLIFPQRCKRTIIDGEILIWDDFIPINQTDISQSLTAGTGTLR